MKKPAAKTAPGKPARRVTLRPGPGLLLGRQRPLPRRIAMGFGPAETAPPPVSSDWLIDSSDSHVAVFAPTGAGKGRNILVPTLLCTSDSAIVMDVKGELARITARFRRNDLGQKVHILDPWRSVSAGSDHFNPLDCLDPADPGLVDDAYALAGLLIEQAAPMKEAYWDECAQSTIAGLIVHVVTAPQETRRNFGRIWQLTHGDDIIYELAVLLDTVTDMHPYARAQIAALISLSADNTRSCIVSVIRQHLRLFGSELVAAAVETTTIDLDLLRRGGPTTIYLVIPADKLKSHNALIRLWLSALLTLMAKRTAPPETTTLLLLDEVAQLGRLAQVTQAITLMRGYGLRCLLLQSLAQLKQHYGAEHEVILDNCATLVTFGHTSFGMAQQLAGVLGDMTAEQLFTLRADELAIRVAGRTTRTEQRVDYLRDPTFAGRFDADPMHHPPATRSR